MYISFKYLLLVSLITNIDICIGPEKNSRSQIYTI